MKNLTLYVTAIPFEELSRFFNITKNFRYIDIDALIKINNLKLSKESHQFVLNQEIKKTFDKFYRYSSLQCKGIIYKNANLSVDTIRALKLLEGIDRIVLIDFWNKKPLTPELFSCDEIDSIIQI